MKKLSIIAMMLIATLFLSACNTSRAILNETPVDKGVAAVEKQVESEQKNEIQSEIKKDDKEKTGAEEQKQEEKKTETPKPEAPKQTSASTKINTDVQKPAALTVTPAATPSPEPVVKPDVPVAPSNLSTQMEYLMYTKNEQHITPVTKSSVHSEWLKKYDGYLTHNENQKVVYLTFDNGYELGYTNSILDTLQKHGIKASFFMTKSFITKNPDLAKRIVNEGHIAANHTVTHRSLNTLNEEQIMDELKGVEDEYKRVTGKTMLKYLRPPKGEFSEKSLYVTKALGYKTIFWSMAYLDWDTKNQPAKEVALEWIKTNHHNGTIILLHNTSKTNMESLDEMLTILKQQGYRFELISKI